MPIVELPSDIKLLPCPFCRSLSQLKGSTPVGEEDQRSCRCPVEHPSIVSLFESAAIESKPMREHQAKFFADCLAAAKAGHKRILGAAATGWGKTRLAAEMFKGSYRKGRVSMFTTPRNALIEPTAEEFEEQGLTDIGVIQQEHPRTNPHALLQVASIHTAVNRTLPQIDFVIVDEVHLQTKAFNALLDSEEWRDKLVIGLSATPWKKGMGFRWKKLVQTIRTSELIENGFLVKPRYLVGSEEPKTAGMKTYLDEEGNRILSEKDEATAMGDKVIVGDVVQTYLEHGESRPFFCYAVNLAHARQLREAFEREGIPCGYIDGSMTREHRLKALRIYREGRVRGLVNYGVLTTGIDEDVRCIIIARIIKSEIDWVQIVGRGLRIDNPKKRVAGLGPKLDCIVIDHGANLTREDDPLPPAEDIYHDYLDTTDARSKTKAYAKDSKPPTYRKCPKCRALVPPGDLKCPTCGIEMRAANSGVKIIDAEFHELGKERPKAARRDEKQRFYAELVEIGRRRGFKKGWVAHTYRKKFGVWPKGFTWTPELHPRTSTWDFVNECMKERARQTKQEVDEVESYAGEF